MRLPLHTAHVSGECLKLNEVRVMSSTTESFEVQQLHSDAKELSSWLGVSHDDVACASQGLFMMMIIFLCVSSCIEVYELFESIDLYPARQ